MARIPEEFRDFGSIPEKLKARVLYEYFVNGGNMEEVARRSDLFESQASQQVSQITRGYGFSGQNQRIFSVIKDADGRRIVPEYDAFLEYVRKYPGGFEHISKENYAGNRGYNNLNDFLIKHYSKHQTAVNSSGFNVDNEFLDNYGKWGCLALIVIPFAWSMLKTILRSGSIWFILLAIGIIAYRLSRKGSDRPNTRKSTTQGRMTVVVFIERFVMLYWIIGSCGGMLANGFPIWQILVAMFVIIVVVSALGRGIEQLLRQLFG